MSERRINTPSKSLIIELFFAEISLNDLPRNSAEKFKKKTFFFFSFILIVLRQENGFCNKSDNHPWPCFFNFQVLIISRLFY